MRTGVARPDLWQAVRVSEQHHAIAGPLERRNWLFSKGNGSIIAQDKTEIPDNKLKE
jgi:hypothetical protein